MRPAAICLLWLIFCIIDGLAWKIGEQAHDRLGLGIDHWRANRWRNWPGGGIFVYFKYRRLDRK